jgi:hypothetical protein
VAQVVENLPGKCEALSSHSSNVQKVKEYRSIFAYFFVFLAMRKKDFYKKRC